MSEPTAGEHAGTPQDDARRWWLDDPRNVDRLLYALYGVCALLLAIDIFVPKHGPFAVEHLFGFYGVFGFVGCVVLVVVAKALRNVLMRPEDYYDD